MDGMELVLDAGGGSAGRLRERGVEVRRQLELNIAMIGARIEHHSAS